MGRKKLDPFLKKRNYGISISQSEMNEIREFCKNHNIKISKLIRTGIKLAINQLKEGKVPSPGPQSVNSTITTQDPSHAGDLYGM